MRVQASCRVEDVREVSRTIHVLTFSSPEISRLLLPGQFVSIRVNPSGEPLLRRPFSVYRTEGGSVQIIFHVVGRGTMLLASRRPGDMLDVLGPLGVPFGTGTGDFATAILVAGGLGVAPLPIATRALGKLGKDIVTFLGARTADQLVEAHLQHVHVSTDDGTRGMRGTVVQLLASWLDGNAVPSPKIFACGPSPMLRALGELVQSRDIPCEVSLEGPMACGFGICQGCPVELSDGPRKYALMCTDGPVFDIRRVRIPA